MIDIFQYNSRCTMEHMGQFKCVISNEAGSDETAGKVTVKPVRTKIQINHIFYSYQGLGHMYS